MSESTPPENENEPDAPLAGMRLAEARRAQDISVLDIAKELHLDEPKVRALEENQFDVLGAPVFAKGHLRKYAELVGVSMDDVLADYYSLNRAVGAPPVVGRPRKPEHQYNVGKWISVVLIMALVGAAATAAYWWFEQRAAEPTAQTSGTVLAPFASSADSINEEFTVSEPGMALETDVAQGDSSPTAGNANIEPVRSDLAGDVFVGQPAEIPLPSPGVPQATLTMSFSGDCWTEVSDASGRRLFFDLGGAGRDVSVTGDAPLRALFGDSANVRVGINGQDYVIPNSMRSGRTARLTVNAP